LVQVRSKGVDIVIGLSHIGYAVDKEVGGLVCAYLPVFWQWPPHKVLTVCRLRQDWILLGM
jgi:2',3'-cyclic-nucleotide 2'-phosphodiesterase (5'-nucleotidase family)